MGEQHPPRLEVICGPMFAGKSSELIRRLAEAAGGGVVVVAAKPAIDTRYHPTAIATHSGGRYDALTIHDPGDLAAVRAGVLGLDEAHFFKKGLHAAVMDAMGSGRVRRVILAGLDRTSMNEPFAEMGRLLVEADEVVKLTAPCAVCGRPAVHTIRLFDSTEDIVVGGAGMFENRCREHLAS